MGIMALLEKPHAVCIPFPAQGHINPMLKLAKLLHNRGFHITFVNTEYNHQRLLRSRGPNSLDGLPSFQFKTIPDGLPPTSADITQDIPSLCESTSKTCLLPFKNLLSKLNDTSSSNVPPVTCIVSDGAMSFTLDAAQEMDESYLSNGYLDSVIDWIPSMKGIRLRDIPSFIRTTNPEDIMLNFLKRETERAKMAEAIILNTYDALEHESLAALSSMLPPVYSIGPLHLLLNDQVTDSDLESIGSNLWKEESGYIEWLNSKEQNSVVYVNFGSITVMTSDQLIEFAWGLLNSKQMFLWVIRPDLVVGDSAILPSEFVTATEDRGLLASWCPQEQVLSHPSIGGFLTHNGWNSTLECIGAGLPMVCWPFFAEQQTNCRYCCTEWGIGMEINNDVKRDEVEELVRELMEREKGKEMRKEAMEWMKMAEEAIGPTGSSCMNLAKVINKVLLPSSSEKKIN